MEKLRLVFSSIDFTTIPDTTRRKGRLAVRDRSGKSPRIGEVPTFWWEEVRTLLARIEG